MVSAEWAVGIVAAVAIAGVLLAVVTSGQVQDALLKFILWVIKASSRSWTDGSATELEASHEQRSRPRRCDGRGMVTAELAVTTLSAFTLLVAMCWGIYWWSCSCGASTRPPPWPGRRPAATMPASRTPEAGRRQERQSRCSVGRPWSR